MSFLSGIFGTSPPPTPEPSASQDLFAHTTFHSNVSPSSSPSSPSPSSSSSTSEFAPDAPTALNTFSTAFDPAKLHPLAGLGDKLDFLQLEEDKLTEVQGAASVLPSRGWTDDLCVGTGTTYLSGLAAGGLWGFKEGYSRPLGANTSFKLRLNSVLNGCTRRGTFVGNSLGVLAIFYNLTNSALDYARGKHDPLNSMASGALSGLIYKGTSGFRPAMLSAGIMTAAAGGWSAFKTMV